MYSSLQINCCPSKAISNQIPLLIFQSLRIGHVHPFDFKRLKPFGCLTFAHQQTRISKLTPTAKRMVFVGLEDNARAARLWDKSTGRILITGDAVYRENIFPGLITSTSSQSHQGRLDILSFSVGDMMSAETNQHQEPFSALPETGTPSPLPISSQSNIHPIEPDVILGDPPVFFPDTNTPPTVATPPAEQLPRRSGRVTAAPIRYGHDPAPTALTTRDHDHPTYTMAMNSPDKQAWLSAMEEEFNSLIQHSVGTLVDPPPDANILGGMWVFSKKRDEHNRVIRFKARWVVFGNHQIEGVDFHDTYASVAKVDSLRVLIALAVSKTFHVAQFDVKTAFLNGDMQDAVYCKQVTGFIHPERRHQVWLLNKSLYGTRQAARRWKQHFSKTTAEFGLTPIHSDDAVYVYQGRLGFLAIHLHVDDSMIFADSAELLATFKTFICGKYELKWTSKPVLYLGIKLTFSDSGAISLSQPQYVESILDRFAMTNCNSVKSPLPGQVNLSPATDEEVNNAKDLPYQSLVGSLQWLASTTRPDIAYAVSQVARFQAAWSVSHWIFAKHILRYVRGTANLGITFSPGPFNPVAFSDSDFSQCITSRRSVTGYIIQAANGPVCWQSRRQSVIALSTTEAEYMAACDCAKQMAWIRGFLFDIHHPIDGPSEFRMDNTSAISIAEGESVKTRSKHIDRRFHFIREQLQQGKLRVSYIPTTEMCADFLTKPLGPTAITHALGLNHMKNVA